MAIASVGAEKGGSTFDVNVGSTTVIGAGSSNLGSNDFISPVVSSAIPSMLTLQAAKQTQIRNPKKKQIALFIVTHSSLGNDGSVVVAPHLLQVYFVCRVFGIQI